MNPLVPTTCQLCNRDTPNLLYQISGFKDDPREFDVVKCKSCDFVYINPRYSEQENFNLYEASYYTDQVIDPSGKLRSFVDDKVNKVNDHRAEWEYLKKYKKGGKILDFGSGPGFFLDVLEGGWEKYAVDTSEFSINNIKDPVVKKFRGTLIDAKFEDNFFDAIYIGHTLDRLTNLGEVLKELGRILSSDGVILVVTPNIGSLCSRVFKDKFRLLYSNHLVYFSPDSLKKYFAQSGFKLVDIRYPYFGTCFFSWSGFCYGTLKILLQVILNMFKMPSRMISPPYWGNIMGVIITRR